MKRIMSLSLNELIKNYVNNREPHERKIGRYNASELWKILNDKLKPEDFLKPKRFDLTACKNITEGEIREMAFKMLLDASEIEYEYQVKKVKKFKDFEIVCVADFIFPDYILECKSPREFTGIKDYHRPQLECQYRLFDKQVYVGYIKSYMTAEFYKYIPSENLWKLILEKVEEFNKNL